MAKNPGDYWDYISGGSGKGQPLVNGALPIVAIATTAGTGSETTLAAVITDAKTHHKYPINDFSLIPHVAVLDETVTLGLPKGITASTGMDALTHAIEGYITAGAWELSDMFHLKAIEIISRSLRGAVNNTPEGREGMALGQYIAGMGFSNVGLGIVHSMAHLWERSMTPLTVWQTLLFCLPLWSTMRRLPARSIVRSRGPWVWKALTI